MKELRQVLVERVIVLEVALAAALEIQGSALLEVKEHRGGPESGSCPACDCERNNPSWLPVWLRTARPRVEAI